jgi:hypothetical protein
LAIAAQSFFDLYRNEFLNRCATQVRVIACGQTVSIAHGVLVHYCDVLVVMGRSREQAQAALERLTVLLGALGLEPKVSKTRIVHLVEGGQRVDFLGFHNRLVRGRIPRSAHLVSSVGGLRVRRSNTHGIGCA